MPIVLDYNQISIAAIMANAYQSGDMIIDENMCRHMIFNTVRYYNTMFRKDYGELIVACDGGNVWRKSFFPHYKGKRKKQRDDDVVDWDMVHSVIHETRRGIRDNFMFRTVHVEGAEADDVIGVLGLHAAASRQPMMIVSGDKDFQQLQQPEDALLPGATEKFVRQHSPGTKKEIVCDDPDRFLGVHVLCGDTGDGIPNILSADDSLVKDVKRPVMSAKMKTEWLEHWSDGELADSFYTEYDAGNIWKTVAKRGTTVDEIRTGYTRNRRLIDLRETPSDVRERIVSAVMEKPKGDREAMTSYFGWHNMSQMMDLIEDFT